MRLFLFRFALLIVLFSAVSTLSSCGGSRTGLAPSPDKATPAIAWAAPAAITNPAPLSATQLDATASVPGTFAYTPAAGTVLAAGTQMLSVTFTPGDTADYNTASAWVSLTVNPAPIVKTTPTISWAAPAAITNPAPLSATQLDATASVAGTFVYVPAAGTVLAAGTQMLSVTFTPTDTTDYTTATSSVSLTVNPAAPAKTTPAITWAQPAGITNPTPLSATQLDATASVPGTFVYMPAADTVLAAGTQTLSATFTPADTTDYNAATASVMLTVNPAPSNTTSLAISDAGNDRVLIYSTPFITDESASVALGQKDLVTSEQNQGGTAAADTLFGPGGLAMDAAGNLYVVDAGNCRVLQYQPPFTTAMSASLVLGQPQFAYNSSNPCYDIGSAGTSGMITPAYVAVDHQGNVWVTDENANRITEYVPPFTNGMVATTAVGQVNLTDSYNCNGANLTRQNPVPQAPTASVLCTPDGLAFDSTGNLWVVDSDNSRILQFVPPFVTGMAASLEIGQPTATAFTSNGNSYTNGLSATSLRSPKALVFDAIGNLWVADWADNRILEFVPPFNNGMTASLVLGQADFTHGLSNQGSGLAANTLSNPVGLSFDNHGNLIVEDAQNNRTLIFSPPFTNNMNAATVLGQPNFSNGAQNQGKNAGAMANTVWGPFIGLAF